MVIEMTKRRFSVKDFHLMDEAGMFCENDRVELVDGEIIEMAGATKRRFSVKDFYLIVDAGILNKYDQVELVDGEIVEMAPIGSYHNGSVNALNRVFARSVPEDITVQVQGPLRVDDTTVFQPDLAILRPKEDEYFETIPAPDDVLLVIEVSDSTEAYDRNVKIPKVRAGGRSRGVARTICRMGSSTGSLTRTLPRADTAPQRDTRVGSASRPRS